MLHLDVISEARALTYLAESLGTDPEVAAVQWIDATLVEATAVVRMAQHRCGLSTKSEWAEDFLSAHRWMRANPDHPDTLAAIAEHGLAS